MLTLARRRAAVVIVAAAAISGLWLAPASAGGGPPGVLAGTQCGQGYTPSCTVTAGAPGTSGTGGRLTASGTPTASGRPGCAGTVSKMFGCVPPGCSITVQTLFCPVGAAAPGGGAAPAPRVLAQLARRYLRLPDPVIRSSPSPDALQLTGLPTWLWIAPPVWQPLSRTARVPGESVTATATPVAVAWSMGDGHTVICHSPGTPYTGRDNPASSSPVCGHTYTRSSAGQPGAAYQVRVTITWQVTWTGTGGAGGRMPPLFTLAAAPMRVGEAPAVNTTGGASWKH